MDSDIGHLNFSPPELPPEFKAWPKIARLNRDIIITEKIDGTNAAVGVTPGGAVYAQSRSRILTPGVKGGDNFGFANWVADSADALREALGPGLHYGEWWGKGIQRGYGIEGKRFSLFNVARYKDISWADYGFDSIGTTPVLYDGPFAGGVSGFPWYQALARLSVGGSLAAPGFMNPEGIVIFHTAASVMFKVTIEGDEKPKGQP